MKQIKTLDDVQNKLDKDQLIDDLLDGTIKGGCCHVTFTDIASD